MTWNGRRLIEGTWVSALCLASWLPACSSDASTASAGGAGGQAGAPLSDAGNLPSSGGSGGSGGVVGSGGEPTGSGGSTGTGGAGSGGASGASGSGGTSPGDAGARASACQITPSTAQCTSRPIVTYTGAGDTRRVYFAAPDGAAPAAGFPAVVLFQGSLFGPATTWNVAIPQNIGFGGYYQVVLVDALLRHGFLVVQPEAQGGLAWNTNNGGNYDTSPDASFIPWLLSELGKGTFGPADPAHYYATGISSGGYMTSRMAVSYGGTFRALAIQSGSYATCLGPLCSVPSILPANHPPTLFLHGDVDTTVPIGTARDYEQKLHAQGIETRFVDDPAAGHQWLAVAPVEVTAWFEAH